MNLSYLYAKKGTNKVLEREKCVDENNNTIELNNIIEFKCNNDAVCIEN